MSNLTEGANVLVVKDGELVPGTIKSVYDVIGLAIVDFGESVCQKVQIDKIALATVTESAPVETITISRKEFAEKCLKLSLSASLVNDFETGYLYSEAYSKLDKMLFEDEDPDDVTTV